LSPALGTSDLSFAPPGSGTQMNGVFSLYYCLPVSPRSAKISTKLLIS
jgi:hypothetical protein